ncbi:hypothetical protein BJ166DRAFT_69131 [Pestalotiopsis sp. NC0098]|nr:hypothetical protein BJ166DRAFT_69131 [Pestalotiopsis sp. NC0098]
MGLRDTLKRLSSVRDRSKGIIATTPADADARAPINSNNPYEAIAEDDYSGDDRRFSDILEVPLNAELPSAADRTGPVSRKPTGKRKPGHTSRLRHNHSVRRSRSVEPSPQDYLYFGDGGNPSTAASPAPPRASLQQSQPRAVSTGAIVTTSNTQSAGRDASGFLNTGMSTNNQQMGYSALTYGGSLQYDYAGVQAQGIGGL